MATNETTPEAVTPMDTNSTQETNTNLNAQENHNTNVTETHTEEAATASVTATTTATNEVQMTDEEKAQQAQHEQEKAQQAQQELEKRQAEEKLEREKAEAERLEKIKQFVEQQTDLYKQIFSHTKETLNINVCKKVEECIASSKFFFILIYSYPSQTNIKYTIVSKMRLDNIDN